MESIIDIFNQKNIEETLNIRQLNYKLEEFITDEMVQESLEFIKAWLKEPVTYNSKAIRKEFIKTLKLDKVIRKIILSTLMSQEQELIAPVVSRILSYLNLETDRNTLHVVSELLAVMAATDLYDVSLSSTGRLLIQSRVRLPKQLMDWVSQCHYLPPMIVAPKIVTNNYESGYLTFDDCLILKSYNQHSEWISLDVINTLNQTPLAVAYEFVSKFEEFPNKEPKTQEAYQQWEEFKKQSYAVYIQTLQKRTAIYFNHKPDKRGRLYCLGYHLNYQGTGFKKASIEFHEKLFIEVPLEYQI